jgi:nitrite reductase/ring-hydroxylating ferredoxin subunit
MRQKYNAQWYKTLSFTQNNTLYSARGGAPTNSQWREQIAVPGKLRIDYMPLTQRSGVLFDGSRSRDEDGGIHALEDRCTHAEVALSEGEVDDCTLECWLHGSRFDLRTGKPTGLPATVPVPPTVAPPETDTALDGCDPKTNNVPCWIVVAPV